ncbi:MAG: MoxR family ATPase [Gemmatimonadales bacterium]|nr:MoxR family ATPase [Gemmatimonadales bacterium]
MPSKKAATAFTAVSDLGAAGSSPAHLAANLERLIEAEIRTSVMIWGPPGIGKSSVVAQVAAAQGLELIDLRLSQLAPTDLRGLPVAADGMARWYPPEFLPRSGKGVLLLDEINMAPPTMQGIAQQLILDRRVGNYVVPREWFIWAAGNRAEDRASVFEMPAPLANRFIHFDVQADFASWKQHALRSDVHEAIIAFLAFRPTLLHHLDESRPAWPSPRSWVMASQLHGAGMSVAPAVGLPAAAEFTAYLEVYGHLPDLDAICQGRVNPAFPAEPSARFAVVIGLAIRATTPDTMRHALIWIAEQAPAEWQSAFLMDLVRRARELGHGSALATSIRETPALRDRVAEFRDLLLG